MRIHRTQMLLAATAVAFTLSGAGGASAHNGATHARYGVCCKINGEDWRAPSLRACRRMGGHFVPNSKCRLGPRDDGPQPRHSTTTRGSSAGPRARSSGPQPRSSTSTRGSSAKPPARHGTGSKPGGKPTSKPGGKPIPNSKPNYPKGCKPRLTVTRYGAFTKAVGRQTVRAAWGALARSKYGVRYALKHSRDRNESCTRKGVTVTCKVSAIPCPPVK